MRLSLQRRRVTQGRGLEACLPSPMEGLERCEPASLTSDPERLLVEHSW